MKKSNFLLMLLSCLFLYSCNDDPVFEEENLVIELREHAFIPGYTDVDVSCIVYSNVSLRSVIMEYSTDKQLSRPFSVALDESGLISDYLQEGEKYYNKNIAGLENNTVYYCRIKIRSSTGYEYKEDFEFTTQNLSGSGVITKEATDITLTSASLNGEIASKSSNLTIGEKGFYYSINSNLNEATKVKVNSNQTQFSIQLSDLLPEKKYYFAAYAVIDGNEYKGTVKNFITTSYTKAQVSTGDVTDINYTSATCAMQILDKGNSSVSEVGILYGNSPYLDSDIDTKVEYTTSSYKTYTTYKTDIKNLQEGTTYYYCAYAINSAGIATGEVKSFTTKSIGEIAIITGQAKNISYNHVYLYYSLKTTGQNVIEYGFIYDMDDNYWGTLNYEDEHFIESIKVSTWGGVDKNYSNQYFYINDLAAGTKYVYCAFVKYINNDGSENIIYGAIDDFETLSYDVPTVTTGNATNVYTTTAHLSLTASSNGSTITDRGFYISSNSNAMYYTDEGDFEKYTSVWTKKSIGKTGVSITLTDLEDGTIYYYVAYATNGEGTGYGSVKSFITNTLTLPEVQTYLDSNSSSSAKLGGYTDCGGEKGVTVGFVYSNTTTNPTLENGKKIVRSTSFSYTDSNYGSFTSTVTYSSSLFSRGVIYYFRAYCTNSKGTTYGGVETFEF